MGVLRESWCFCKGVSKSQKMKASIFSGKGPALARITGTGAGTGFLIHRHLLLTSHANIPSVASAEGSEIRLKNGVAATLFPHRFFVTSSVLDLTIVGIDVMEADLRIPAQQIHPLKTCSKPNLDLGSTVYILGYTEKKELTVGEGKAVIATDNLIKLSTDGVIWNPGSAGFDLQGNLAFMICNPMKLATSPNTKSTSTSSSPSLLWKKALPMQFGIPIPVICDWLNQHWEGSLDEPSKPKLPIIRLISASQKSERSCASFTMRQVFKSAEADDNGTASSSNIVLKSRNQLRQTYATTTNAVEAESLKTNSHPTHVEGIATPEIYESLKLTAVPIKNRPSQLQLLDINFPPGINRVANPPQLTKKLHPNSDNNCVNGHPQNQLGEDQINEIVAAGPKAVSEVGSTASANESHAEMQRSTSPIEIPDLLNGYSSEEETMYSAETAESRNYTTPRDSKFQQVGRSHSCVNYNRWQVTQRIAATRREMLENHSLRQGRKGCSQGATPQRSNEYLSPTVSSIMKKRNSLEQQVRPRQGIMHSSPRWAF